MKTFKLIFTNLTLVFVLVILTGNVSFANSNIAISLDVTRDDYGKIDSYLLKIGEREGVTFKKYYSLEELEDYEVIIENTSSSSSNDSTISFRIDQRLNSGIEDDGVKINYESQNKVFKISSTGNSTRDEQFYYDGISELTITISDKDRIDYPFVYPLEKASYPEVSFSVVPIFSSPVKYMLNLESDSAGLGFRDLENIDVYSDATSMEEYFSNVGQVKHLEKRYTYGNTYEIKDFISGHVYGTFTIPNIKSIDIEKVDDNSEKIKIIKTLPDGSKSIMKLDEMKKIGWVKIHAENKTTEEDYEIEITSEYVNNEGIIELPERGNYEIIIYGGATEIYRKSISFEFRLDFSDVQILREGYNYALYFPTPLPELKKLNSNKDFKIKITDMSDKQIPEKVLTSSQKDDTEGHIQKYGDDTPLYLYDKVRIHFTCKATGLNEVIVRDVPPFGDFEDIIARITEPGNISFYDIEDNEVSFKQMSFMLKAFASGLLGVELWYDGGTETIENPVFMDWGTNECKAAKIEDFTSHLDYDFVVGSYYKIYSYYKAVVDSGTDKKLFLVVYSTRNMDKKVMIEVDKPQGSGLKYPWLQTITGLSSDEIESIVRECDELINNNVQIITDKLIIPKDEVYKDFKIAKGVYYVTEKNGRNYLINTVGNGDEISISKAGTLTGEEKNGIPLGEYIVYNPAGNGTTSYTLEFDKANTYPFLNDVIYRVHNKSDNQEIEVEFKKIDPNMGTNTGDLVEIYETGMNVDETIRQRLTHKGIMTGYILSNKLFKPLSKYISRFIRTLANGLNLLVQLSLNALDENGNTFTVDIDAIIFNNFSDTSIAFFKSNNGGDNPSKLIEMFRDGITYWYDVFRGLAIAGYLIILLYIGIKILLSVGGEKQAKYKELLSNWVVGIILLFFFPYVIKYAIEINGVFVEMIEDSKLTVLKVVNSNPQIDLSGYSLPTLTDKDSYTVFASKMENSPFSDLDKSYMATIAKRAHRSEEIVDAVVYLILVWQFIMIVIMYYKRVFTVAFLIAIFPIVMISYAIDKIADGKAQAFSTWTKEIMINIFVQSMHAVVYVFVIGATYANGVYSGDFLLSIVGITFLFKGEEILKKIIGQSGSSTVRSLGKTAARAVLTIKAAQKVSKNVSDNFIGSNSHLGRAINTYRKYSTQKKIARNMDLLGKPAYKPPKGNKLNTYNTDGVSNLADYNELADDIQIVNNMGKYNDPEKIAKALRNVSDNMHSNDESIKNLMKGLKLSNDQLFELGKLRDNAVRQYQQGDKSTEEKRAELKASINSDLQARLRVILPELNEQGDIGGNKPLSPDNQRKADVLSAAMFKMIKDSGDKSKKHKNRNSDFASTKAEYLEAERIIEKAYNTEVIANKGISNVFSEEAKKPKISGRTEARRNSILETHYNTTYENATKEQRKMAESIAIACNFMDLSDETISAAETQKLTADQYMTAVTYVAEHQNDSVENRNAVNNNYRVRTGESIRANDMVSIVAEEITRTYTDVSKERSGDHRRAIVNGADADIPEPLNGLGIQKELVTRSIQSAYDRAKERVKEEEEEYGTRLHFDSSKDEFEGKDIIERMHHNGYDLDSYIGYMTRVREEQNDKEVREIEDFAREMIDDLPKYSNEATYEGLTQREHEEYAEDLKQKFIEELARTGVTTVGATLGAPMGAGLAIGLSDDESAVAEGLAGAAVGILGGDQLAENAMGKEISQGGKSRKVKILNPYTNEIEDFELKRDGVTSDAALIELINPGEVLRYDDYRLDHYSYNLNRQYLEHKAEKQRAMESERLKGMIDEALRNSRDRDGRV